MVHKTDSRKRELVETTLTEAIDYYLTALAMEGKSPETIVWYRKKLTCFAVFMQNGGEPARVSALSIEGYYPQVRCRVQAIAQLDTWFDQHPDALIFQSLPGTGDLLAPGLLVKFGDHRDRFPQVRDVQALAGTCPVTERSGKRKVVRFRHGCDREFRRFAVQFARASKLQSGWAAEYWQEIRPHCDSDAHADRILANRWLAIIWKMWQDRKPYDETYHLQQRALRRKPKA